MPLGQLPKEYNKAVHGPYDPAVFYGKKDVPLGTVKLQDVPSWISRRNLTPTAMGQALSRAYWRSDNLCTFNYGYKNIFCAGGTTSSVCRSTAASHHLSR